MSGWKLWGGEGTTSKLCGSVFRAVFYSWWREKTNLSTVSLESISVWCTCLLLSDIIFSKHSLSISVVHPTMWWYEVSQRGLSLHQWFLNCVVGTRWWVLSRGSDVSTSSGRIRSLIVSSPEAVKKSDVCFFLCKERNGVCKERSSCNLQAYVNLGS